MLFPRVLGRRFKSLVNYLVLISWGGSMSELIGYLGMLFVFTSFIIRNWLWLHVLNGIGTALLLIYALILGNRVFAIVEGGVLALLAYRVYQDLKSGDSRQGFIK
jgi:signal transduction histidine kinase